MVAFEAEGDGEAASLFEFFVKLLPHPGDDCLQLWIADEIVCLVRINGDVVQFVCVVDAVVLDEFVAVSTQGEGCGRLREVGFPVVFVKLTCSPTFSVMRVLEQLCEAGAVHGLGNGDTADFQQSWCNVDVGDDGIALCIRGNRVWPVCEQRDAH